MCFQKVHPNPVNGGITHSYSTINGFREDYSPSTLYNVDMLGNPVYFVFLINNTKTVHLSAALKIGKWTQVTYAACSTPLQVRD